MIPPLDLELSVQLTKMLGLIRPVKAGPLEPPNAQTRFQAMMLGLGSMTQSTTRTWDAVSNFGRGTSQNHLRLVPWALEPTICQILRPRRAQSSMPWDRRVVRTRKTETSQKMTFLPACTVPRDIWISPSTMAFSMGKRLGQTLNSNG